MSSPIGGAPEKTPGTGGIEGGLQGNADVGGVAQEKGATLGALKSAIMKEMGDEEGKKFYDMFIKTVVMMSLNQMRQASERAKKAAQEMRMRT